MLHLFLVFIVGLILVNILNVFIFIFIYIIPILCVLRNNNYDLILLNQFKNNNYRYIGSSSLVFMGLAIGFGLLGLIGTLFFKSGVFFSIEYVFQFLSIKTNDDKLNFLIFLENHNYFHGAKYLMDDYVKQISDGNCDLSFFQLRANYIIKCVLDFNNGAQLDDKGLLCGFTQEEVAYFRLSFDELLRFKNIGKLMGGNGVSPYKFVNGYDSYYIMSGQNKYGIGFWKVESNITNNNIESNITNNKIGYVVVLGIVVGIGAILLKYLTN